MLSRSNSPASLRGGKGSPPFSGGGGGSNMSEASNSDTTMKTSNTGGAASASAPGNNNNDSGMNSFKLGLLIMMVLQNSSTVLVGRYTRSSVAEEELFDVNHLILVIEMCKLILSCGLEFYATSGKLWPSLQIHVLDRPMDAMKILVPALLYLVQNTLLYVALSNLTAPVFQVTYQAKLVTTAIVSVFMLQRSYAVRQWICLVILSIGVAIVVLGEKKASSSSSSGSGGTDKTRRMLQEAAASAGAPAAQNLLLGLVAVSIACFSSALAGVYFEKVLKKPPQDATKQAPASLWMRNIQLSFFSIFIALGQSAFKESTGKPYLHGFSAWAWVLVMLQAGGGLLVAAVIKYADNVLKGLATGVSVVFATCFSILFMGTPLSGQFTLGATMILTSVYFFSNPLPPSLVGKQAENKKGESVVETKKLLPA